VIWGGNLRQSEVKCPGLLDLAFKKTHLALLSGVHNLTSMLNVGFGPLNPGNAIWEILLTEVSPVKRGREDKRIKIMFPVSLCKIFSLKQKRHHTIPHDVITPSG
jgi:hypothetical protein